MPHLIKRRQYNIKVRKSYFFDAAYAINSCKHLFFLVVLRSLWKKALAAQKSPSTTVIAIKNNLLQGHHYLLECTISVFSHDQVFYICTKILRTDKLTLKCITYQAAGTPIFMKRLYTTRKMLHKTCRSSLERNQ